ncbi:hypothetical protein [Paraburkholderia tagetis]|uniref:Uncharacterized protein n=1 Tax=Paraburkholderia tagetis TaxID=2913261 RepID=A0A9X1UGF6_9BURK|nr:hypothetical protein [Paraburkholderia tagetis]MCG5075609.1 hypothetical protein [Paraburkholderia tagetis]
MQATTTMTIGSRAKRKPVRNKKPGSEMLVAEWTIEHAQTPEHVSISFVVRSNGTDEPARCVTSRFLLPSESAAELIEDLRDALEGCAAMASLGGEVVSPEKADDGRGEYAGLPSNAEDVDPMSNHFALGAYGLVGN